LIETHRPGAAIERALYPSGGVHFYIKEGPLDPPAWLLSTVGLAGHITSPWLVYGLLNLAGLALLLSLTQRLRTRPRLAAMLRWMITLTGLAALIYVDNGFFEFRSSTSESVTAFFGRLRFTALVMMSLTLWILAKRFDAWLNKVALVVLTLADHLNGDEGRLVRAPPTRRRDLPVALEPHPLRDHCRDGS
jgi:hypothetical protein